VTRRMTDSESEGNTSSSIYIPRDRLDRVRDVHGRVSRYPDRTALWRTVERGLDALERELDSDGE